MYDDGSIVLSNDIAKLVISENAELISCIDLKSNVDISAHNHKKNSLYYIGANGLVSIQRGQCGTKAVSHKAGAKVRLIGGYYSHIAPWLKEKEDF